MGVAPPARLCRVGRVASFVGRFYQCLTPAEVIPSKLIGWSAQRHPSAWGRRRARDPEGRREQRGRIERYRLPVRHPTGAGCRQRREQRALPKLRSAARGGGDSHDPEGRNLPTKGRKRGRDYRQKPLRRSGQAEAPGSGGLQALPAGSGPHFRRPFGVEAASKTPEGCGDSPAPTGRCYSTFSGMKRRNSSTERPDRTA